MNNETGGGGGEQQAKQFCIRDRQLSFYQKALSLTFKFSTIMVSNKYALFILSLRTKDHLLLVIFSFIRKENFNEDNWY